MTIAQSSCPQRLKDMSSQCIPIQKWIPFSDDYGGNHLGIDFDPDENGTIGLVIIFGRDEDEKFLVASSFAEFLALVLLHLRTIQWSFDEDGWNFDAEENALHYHDWLRNLVKHPGQDGEK
ncbi:SMI1/KNR4 family protein [Undibacterium sp. TJN25]|uniref:SMI1/KNR4 family protein n=1 Tax=Undibacterium sp. TJN25 TaxID=3413056 RepID=UPI003BF1805D